MDQGPPSFQRVLRDSERVAAAEAFSLPASALAGDLPAEVVSTGLRYLIVPLRREIESAAIAHPALQELLAEVGADFAYLLEVESREGRTWENDGSLSNLEETYVLLERRNCSPGVGSVITTLTTHRLQQHFSKTREFHSVVRAADSAKGQLGQAAAESRQSSPGRRESEPWSSSTDPPATPCAFHRRHM